MITALVHPGFLPVMKYNPRISARVLDGLPQFLANRSVQFAALTRMAGIDVDTLYSPYSYVALRAVLQLYELAATACKDEAFGLKYAVSYPMGADGLFYYIITNSATVRDSLKARIHYGFLVTDIAYWFSLKEYDGVGHFEWKEPPRIGHSPQFTNYVVGLIVQSVRNLLRRKTWTPLRVDLQQEQPKGIVTFRRLLGCNVTFGCDVNRIVVDSATLRAPVKSADARLYRLLSGFADKELDALRLHAKFIDRVTHEIETSILSGQANISRVAGAMGLSVRKLQRELERSGKSFRELVEETKHALAMHLLIKSDRSIKEISYMLGFSEPSAFSRAASKWFGASPRELRARRVRIA